MDLNNFRELLPQDIQDYLTEIDRICLEEETQEKAEDIAMFLEEKYGIEVEYGDWGIEEVTCENANEEYFVPAMIEVINDMTDDDLIALHNEMMQDQDRMDDCIYYNDEATLEEHFSSVTSAIRACFYGDYNFSHNYFVFNGYANLDSFENPKSHIDIEELANWAVLEEKEELLS